MKSVLEKEHVGKPGDNKTFELLADKIVEIPSSRIQKMEVSRDLDKLIEKLVKEREERINRLLDKHVDLLSIVMPHAIRYLKLHFPSLSNLINTLALIAGALIIAFPPIILLPLMWIAKIRSSV